MPTKCQTIVHAATDRNAIPSLPGWLHCVAEPARFSICCAVELQQKCHGRSHASGVCAVIEHGANYPEPTRS
jgi:hypothetical protein